MKCIIAGSRTITDKKLVLKAIEDSKIEITEIISGHANGVDKIGEQISYDLGIDLVIFPANWKKWGKSAGPIRNKKMLERAEAAIIVHNCSSGSVHMAKIAREKGINVYEYKL